MDTQSICPGGAPLDEIECLGPASESADAELERVYEAAVESILASGAPYPMEEWEAALRSAQTAWAVTRDADCSLVADYEYYMGTGAGAAGARCHLRYTMSRTQDLRSRYQISG